MFIFFLVVILASLTHTGDIPAIFDSKPISQPAEQIQRTSEDLEIDAALRA